MKKCEISETQFYPPVSRCKPLSLFRQGVGRVRHLAGQEGHSTQATALCIKLFNLWLKCEVSEDKDNKFSKGGNRVMKSITPVNYKVSQLHGLIKVLSKGSKNK